MIHPDTEVRFVSPSMGHGVFATADIPRGTIIFVKDSLDIELTEEAFNALDEPHRAVADKYSYIDECGVRILSWDNAKFMNHRCDSNTLSTGYGFEIAIRDIREGEEICDDYGQFNLEEAFPVTCNCPCCRKAVRPDDQETQHEAWDAKVLAAMTHISDVRQPLMQYMDARTKDRLRAYLCGEEPYTSVLALKCRRKPSVPVLGVASDSPITQGGFNG